MNTLFLFSFAESWEWFANLISPQLNAFSVAMQAFVPKFVGALFLLLFGWAIGKALARVVRRVLERIGTDKLAERLSSIELFSKLPVKIKPSAAIAKFLYYVIFFIFFMAAMDILQLDAVSQMINSVFSYLPKLVSALLVFIIGVMLADFLKRIVHTALASLNIPAASLIANFIFYFLFINVAMITLSQAGIATDFIQDNLSIILGGVVAAFAIGYGYASRPQVANFLAAYYNRGKIQIGSIIEIEGVKGEVVEIDNSSFTIANTQGKVIVPLNKLSTEKYTLFDGIGTEKPKL